MAYFTKYKIFKQKKIGRQIMSLLIVVVFFVAYDLLTDIDLTESFKDIFIHFFVEGIILSGSLAALYLCFKMLKVENSTKNRAIAALKDSRRSEYSYRRKAKNFIVAFHHILFGEFKKWNLTKAEREIAIFILKGLTTEEIALIRSTSIKTIRNQCSSIYEKTNLSGKSELISYFLSELIEDIEIS